MGFQRDEFLWQVKGSALAGAGGRRPHERGNAERARRAVIIDKIGRIQKTVDILRENLCKCLPFFCQLAGVFLNSPDPIDCLGTSCPASSACLVGRCPTPCKGYSPLTSAGSLPPAPRASLFILQTLLQFRRPGPALRRAWKGLWHLPWHYPAYRRHYRP